jgi:nucleoside-diphosphate kinase
VQAFYEEHKQKKFFSSLVEFMTSSPIMVICLEGENAIDSSRKVIGATDPTNAEDGTIRKIFGTSIENNAVHGSDSLLSAEREIKFFFPGLLP